MIHVEIDPAMLADVEKFEVQLTRYLNGDLEEDAFRVFRLNNGVYGQRQVGHNQMLRVKAPYGSITPEQLDMAAHIADEYSRGWGHLTTRQNIQFHYVQLERVPGALRDLVGVGLTSREACGDTVRNVMGCHLAFRDLTEEQLPVLYQRLADIGFFGAERRAHGKAAPGYADLKDLDHFPTPDEAPEYYVDFDETGPYVAETGASECAT